jgi:hypothetical protein
VSSALLALLLVVESGPTTAGAAPRQPASPPAIAQTAGVRQSIALPRGGLKAVVVRSWSGCGSAGVVWDDLNANWSQYGSIPIVIDYSDPSLCAGPITLSALQASGADVMIISDPSGGGQQWSQEEADAVAAYAAEGHNIVGTFLVFDYITTHNTFLAPLFGLVDQPYSGHPSAAVYDLVDDPTFVLFRDVPDPFASSGFKTIQTPLDGRWSSNELQGAKLVARTARRKGIITQYDSGSYNAIYISNMPEYGGGTADKQLLYNAIIYPNGG